MKVTDSGLAIHTIVTVGWKVISQRCVSGSKVLTSAEINAKDHFYQVEPDADGLVSYWKFDEGAGTAIHDYSGNENNATAVESLTWTAVELPAK